MTTQNDYSVGIKKESTYGTGVTVDRFFEAPDVSFDVEPEFTQGAGRRVGSRVQRASRRLLTKLSASGTIEIDASDSGMGLILEAALGTVTTTEIPTSTGVYQQVHTPTTSDNLPSYTIQTGTPPIGGGSTHAVTYVGAQCESVEIAASAGEFVKFTSEWIAKDYNTSDSYAAPSYATDNNPFSFTHGAIYVGNTITKATTTALASATGSALATVRDISVKWSNGLDSEGFNMGGNGRRTRAAVVGDSVIDGSMTVEYEDNTLRDAWLDNTDLTLLLTFTQPTALATGIYATLQVHVPLIKLNGEMPKSASGAPITQTIPFVGLDSLAASTSPVYFTYRSLDTTP